MAVSQRFKPTLEASTSSMSSRTFRGRASMNCRCSSTSSIVFTCACTWVRHCTLGMTALLQWGAARSRDASGVFQQPPTITIQQVRHAQLQPVQVAARPEASSHLLGRQMHQCSSSQKPQRASPWAPCHSSSTYLAPQLLLHLLELGGGGCQHALGCPGNGLLQGLDDTGLLVQQLIAHLQSQSANLSRQLRELRGGDQHHGKEGGSRHEA